jgi:hypothetical protein
VLARAVAPRGRTQLSVDVLDSFSDASVVLRAPLSRRLSAPLPLLLKLVFPPFYYFAPEQFCLSFIFLVAT